MAAVSAGKCPFGFDDTPAPIESAPRVQNTAARYPSDLFVCSASSGKTRVSKTPDAESTQATYKEVFKAITDLYDSIPASAFPNDDSKMKFAACTLRAAGHDFMDFRVAADGSTSGGADGCLDFDDADNAGLQMCLENSGILGAYAPFCDRVSIADFLVIAGEALAVRTSIAWPPAGEDMWGKKRGPFATMNNFKFGRTTVDTCDHSTGSLMPNPEEGCAGLKNIFVDHIYKRNGAMAWNMTAAISGAHTLGRATQANSGYDGFWDSEEESGKFNNGYYKSILAKGWYRELAVGGNVNKNQFKRIDRGLGDGQMMLSTDMCLAMMANEAAADDNCDRPDGRRCEEHKDAGEFLLAQNHDCCAWVEPQFFFDQGIYTEDQTFDFCGEDFTAGVFGFGDGDHRRDCCRRPDNGSGEKETSFGDCDFKLLPQGPAIEAVIELATNNEFFLQAFLYSWSAATTNGYTTDDLTAIGTGQGLSWYGNYFKQEVPEEQRCAAKTNFKKCFRRGNMVFCLINEFFNWLGCKFGWDVQE